MRTIEFKMERQGLVQPGQEVEVSAHDADSGCCYIIEPAVAMSGCYKGRDKLKPTMASSKTSSTTNGAITWWWSLRSKIHQKMPFNNFFETFCFDFLLIIDYMYIL